jgi:glycerophosphoryl diester phosphodiesterase
MELLKSKTGRVLVESHRGVQRDLPENSWPAIKAAKSEGADFIEVDVQLSKDGVAFLRHNYKLDDERWAHDLSWSDLAQMRTAGEAFPLLSDVLVWAKEEQTKLSLDLKTGFLLEHTLVKAVIKNLNQTDCWDCAMLMAWDHKELFEIKKSYPHATTRAFVTGRPMDLVQVAKAAKVNAVSLAYGVARTDDVVQLHAAGIGVALGGFWELDIEMIHELDVDIICSGQPAEAKKALSIK